MKPKHIAITVVLAFCALAVLILCLGIGISEESLDYSLTPEGVEANLNNGTLLVKHTDEANSTIYTIPDNATLISLLQIENWTAAEGSPTDIPTIVIRIGEGYEVALYSDGLILVYNEYSGNRSDKTYYASSANASTIAEYLQTNASICESPWGAFIN